MEKKIEIYYADKKVNTIVVEMEEVTRTAVLKDIEVHTNDMWLSFFGEMPENCLDFLNRRSYLSQKAYYSSGKTSGYSLYTAVEILLKTHGLSYMDKFWLKDADENMSYSDVIAGFKSSYKRYYGVAKREFMDNTVTTYFDDSYTSQKILGNLIVSAVLDNLNLIQPVQIRAFSDNSVTYDNVCKDGEYLISAYDILLRNFDYGVFGYAKSQPISTYKNIVRLLNEATGLDVSDYLSRFLFIDSLILNEGHYLANIYFACNEATGEYRFVPYLTYNHILGIEHDTPLEKKAESCHCRTICANFDVLGMLMVKQGIDFKNVVVVPIANIIEFGFNIVDIKNMCAIIGYRYQQLTGGVVNFDDGV